MGFPSFTPRYQLSCLRHSDSFWTILLLSELSYLRHLATLRVGSRHAAEIGGTATACTIPPPVRYGRSPEAPSVAAAFSRMIDASGEAQ